MEGQIGSLPDGSPWDSAAERRGDRDWIENQWHSPDSRVVLMYDGQVAVDSDDRPLWMSSGRLPDDVLAWAFLGIDAYGCARFVASAAPASVMNVDDWLPLRSLPSELAAELFSAVSLMNWHANHTHCPRCGAATSIHEAGWQRVCPEDNSRHFPRVDPAVIMLIHDGFDRTLLGRHKRWPVGWFSTLAGFVEPGETLADAVVREVAEEVGLRVVETTYLGSQSWPFPNSLMVGFHAKAEYAAPQPDGDEIEEARWLTREELAASSAAGTIKLPPALSISRWLIQQWYGAELPGEWVRT